MQPPVQRRSALQRRIECLAVVSECHPVDDQVFLISGRKQTVQQAYLERVCPVTGTSLTLPRLARRCAVTQHALIEQLVIAEDGRILSGIELDSAQRHEYFFSAPLRSNDEHQIHDYPPTIAKEQRQI
jgi:hypothetical protein